MHQFGYATSTTTRRRDTVRQWQDQLIRTLRRAARIRPRLRYVETRRLDAWANGRLRTAALFQLRSRWLQWRLGRAENTISALRDALSQVRA